MHKPRPELVLFPGEGEKTVKGFKPDDPPIKVTVGRIYVLHGAGESYECCGGPPPGEGYKNPNDGGHSAGSTPKGVYVLADKEHHTTRGWPMSVIPWGAELRLESGEVQFKIGKKWHTATGRKGEVTSAQMRFQQRSGKHPDFTNENDYIRGVFLSKHTGNLWMNKWVWNDFGRWSWNMMRHGHRSVYYIHTTPMDELNTVKGTRVELMNSHGCVHIRPVDRDDMISKGYLKKGMKVTVEGYGEKGPPKK